MPRKLFGAQLQEAAPMPSLNKVINDAMGQWADEREAANLSRDLAFGPVRAQAAAVVNEAVLAYLSAPGRMPGKAS